ncbi:MAG TPA: hypothetical protein VN957_14190 [Chthoniobacterales bacterium]|nr:hypothetical protein [Chthoniobacterales bacterium]
MAKLNDLLSRIQTDYGFYLQICVLLTFQKSPHAALAAYKLSSEERIALTESGAQLWAHLRHPIPTTQTSQGWTFSEVVRSEFIPTTQVGIASIANSQFDPTTALRQPEVMQTLARIHGASAHTDRLKPVLALMEQIG